MDHRYTQKTEGKGALQDLRIRRFAILCGGVHKDRDEPHHPTRPPEQWKTQPRPRNAPPKQQISPNERKKARTLLEGWAYPRRSQGREKSKQQRTAHSMPNDRRDPQRKGRAVMPRRDLPMKSIPRSQPNEHPHNSQPKKAVRPRKSGCLVIHQGCFLCVVGRDAGF